VTVGKGNLIDGSINKSCTDPSELALDPRLHWLKSGGVPAAHDDIVNQWNMVKSHTEATGNTSGWWLAQPWNELYLTADNIEDFCRARMGEFAHNFVKQGINFQSFPADAQVAALAWAWATGGSLKGWPKLTQALKTADFQTAGLESISRDFNVPRALLVKQCYNNAADVMAQGLDHSKLVYPNYMGELIRQAKNEVQQVVKAVPGGNLGLMVLVASAAYVGYTLWIERQGKGEVAAEPQSA